MKKELSEKTLEINICAEILGLFRANGYPKAYWIGMKQDQEFRNGLDGLLKGVRGYHLMLQFKSPRPSPKDTAPYKFAIGGKQLNALRWLSNLYPDAVYYTLPSYNTISRFANAVPNVINDTWLLRVKDVPTGTSHRVETDRGIARIFSEPVKQKLHPIETLIKTQAAHLIPSEKVLAWVDSVSGEFPGADAGQIFRGLAVISFPLQINKP